MDRISVNGENFVKASLIARELGYTSDYVGQLCRSKQVEAKLVGRSWYVNEKSIRAHKEGRYRSTAQKSKIEVKKALSLIDDFTTPNYLKRVVATAKYEADTEPVFPIIKKAEESETTNKIKPIRINPIIEAESHKLPTAVNKQTFSHQSVPNGRRITSVLHKPALISARSNQINQSVNVRIKQNRKGTSFSSSKFATVTLTGLFVAALAVSILSLTLESRVTILNGAPEQSLNFNYKLLKNAIFEYIK